MNQKLLADAVKYGFRLTHTEDGWIAPFLDAVSGVEYEAAIWKPSGSVPSIWEIVEHALPYTKGLLCDLTGVEGTESDDWPAIKDASPEAWLAMQDRVKSVVTALQATVEGLSEDELIRPPNGRKKSTAMRIMDLVVHDSYHSGQVIKLTQMYAAVSREPAPV